MALGGYMAGSDRGAARPGGRVRVVPVCETMRGRQKVEGLVVWVVYAWVRGGRFNKGPQPETM